ncbi:MAG: hypothetical protein HYX68_27530 [Planctomycetes bacterium]|nr:hypothetical protein [Planctomycetota bacterium]
MRNPAKFTKQRQQAPAPSAPPAKAAGGNARRWIVLGLGALLTAAATWSFLEFVVWNKVLWNQLPGDLIGKWVVSGGDQDGATFDFYRNGSMRGRINAGGREGIINARIEVEGDTLFITTRNPHTKQDEVKKHLIKVLNRSELVLQDERKTLFRMERAD